MKDFCYVFGNARDVTSETSKKPTPETSNDDYYLYPVNNFKKYRPSGLNNIGNTCFMNSALQCLFRVKDLTNYFLHDKYIRDLNHTNPLGMNGDVAGAYAELIKEVFSKKQDSVTPWKLKRQVARYAPQFADFHQQDSQEFMNFLLDALHEDLKKEGKKSSDSSIISQLFHATIQSSVICSQCRFPVVTSSSISFLPLPISKMKSSATAYIASPTTHRDDKKSFDVTIIRADGTIADSRKYTQKHHCDTIRDLLDGFDSNIQCHDRYLSVVINDNQVKHKLDDDELLKKVSSEEQIIFYELEHRVTDKKYVLIECSFSVMDKDNQYFRLPMFLSIAKNDCHLKNIKKKLESKLCGVFGLSKIKLKVQGKKDSMETDQSFGDSLLIWDDSRRSDAYIEIEFHNNDGTKLTIYVTDSLIPNACRSNLSASKALKHDVHGRSSSNAGSITVETCVEEFLKPESLGANGKWFCSECNELTDAEKKISFVNLPKYLILQLKRFNFDHSSNRKIDDLVEFPLYDLDLSNFLPSATGKAKMTYDLLAVSNHSGSLVSGHYTAYSKSFINDKWYHFNDSCVKPVAKEDENKIVSANAYVLVYAQNT